MSQSSSSGDMGFYSQSPPVAVSTPNRDISHSQTAGTSFDGTYSAGLISNSTSYESNYPNGSRHLISQPSSSPATYSEPSCQPHLSILYQPQNEFRFRYISESKKNKHGLLGADCLDSNKRQELIRVQLKGWQDMAIIRCSLVTNSHDPIPHIHRLLREKDDVTKIPPGVEFYDVQVSSSNEWTATFDEIRAILLTKRDDPTRQNVSENEIDLHSVKLKFEAFIFTLNGYWAPVCHPIYSNPIYDKKGKGTGELKIQEISKKLGSCKGGDEVWILVNKVNKKDIKIRFFDQDRSWEALANFSESDVHYQHCIIFRTPPYKNPEIETNVEVFFELYRPTASNGTSTSEPFTFTYHPEPNQVGFSSCMSSGNGIAPLRLNEHEQEVGDRVNQPGVLAQLLPSDMEIDQMINTYLPSDEEGLMDFSNFSPETYETDGWVREITAPKSPKKKNAFVLFFKKNWHSSCFGKPKTVSS